MIDREAIADAWEASWPWLIGLVVASVLFFVIADVALARPEHGHTCQVMGKLYRPPYTTTSCSTSNKHLVCTTTRHPETFELSTHLDMGDDREFLVSSMMYARTNQGAVLGLDCKRGFYTKHLYCSIR